MKEVKCCGSCEFFAINRSRKIKEIYRCTLEKKGNKGVNIFDQHCEDYINFEGDSQSFILDSVNYFEI